VPHIWLDNTLENNEILIPYRRYNELYGTNYTASTIDEFTPHTVKVSQYRYYDIDNEEKLCETELKIAGLTTHDSGNYYPIFFVSKEMWDYFAKSTLFVSGLYFDSNENIDVVIDLANELGYEQNIAAVEGIRTMTKAVDVFIPIFRLIAIFLCVGVVFILVNFSTKMIKDKMHEIGILKAIGTSNKSIAVIFGLQILLIAVLTSVMTTIGYYYFIDLANDVLIESLKQLAKSHVVLDLQFLTFKVDIALTNCALVLLLAAASLLVPIIKIKNIKPVKIIKAKE
jgi:ABC-type antimicrobial peptide transport system permease subunit